jgi:Spy/CpxP family protein refolding chaperone
MSKRSILGMTAAILSVAAGAAIASDEPAGREERRAERRVGHGRAALVEYLGLTDQQKTGWRALHEQRREAMKPFAEEGRALRQRLREAVEAPTPDPAAVGEATLALKAHREKARAEREGFRAKLEGLLDPAQKEKLKALEAARRVGPGRDGRRGHGFHRQAPETSPTER